MADELKKDYKLEPEKKSDIDKRIEETGVPVYMERLELTDEDKKRAQSDIWKEWDEIRKERDEDHFEETCDALDAQYDGELEENEAQQFNIDRGITAVKCDKITSLILQAFMDSDPIYSVTPRPEFAGKNGTEVCEKQSDFLDDKLDNLPFRNAEALSVHSAVVKGLGITKIKHLIKRQKRRREERYQGNPMPKIDEQGNAVMDPLTKKPVIVNTGLDEFLQNWPNAAKDYPGYIKKLQEGQEINFITTYKDTTFNDPYPSNVDIKNFWVRKNTDGYEGLKTTRLTIEEMEYTWWELKQEERQKNFYDIDKLKDEYDEAGKVKGELKNYEFETFTILECVYFFKIKPDDEEETRVVLWFEKDSKVNIGATLYPYFAVDAYYVPHYLMRKKPGFYQPGVAERLTGNGIAENAILNFTLEGAWLTNSVTPITKDQDIVDQFLEKKFRQGIPIIGDPKSIDFLNKYMRPMDVSGLLALMQYMVQSDDEKSRVSSLMSGKESAIDPTAPAAKTLALLQQSGVDIRDFQSAMVPAFNEIGYIYLALYYQMSQEGRKYRARPERVTGDNPFNEISRNEMVARTNIQVSALSYDFDQMNMKAETVALIQLIRQEPLIARNPEAVHLILKTALKNWGRIWKNMADKLLPSLEALKKQQVMMAMQALDTYIKAKVQESQTTGVAPEFDLKELMPLMSDLMAELATPPSKEVVVERQKIAQKGGASG